MRWALVGLGLVATGLLLWIANPYITPLVMRGEESRSLEEGILRTVAVTVIRGDILEYEVIVRGGAGDIKIQVEIVAVVAGLSEGGGSYATYTQVVDDPGVIESGHRGVLEADADGHFTFYLDNIYSEQSKTVTLWYHWTTSVYMSQFTTAMRNLSLVFGPGIVLLGLLQPRTAKDLREGPHTGHEAGR